MQPAPAGTVEISTMTDRVNALNRSFMEGCRSAIACGTLTSPSSEETYASDITRRFGYGTILYYACLKAWRTGYNTTRQVAS
jgi:hypothetical protein